MEPMFYPNTNLPAILYCYCITIMHTVPLIQKAVSLIHSCLNVPYIKTSWTDISINSCEWIKAETLIISIEITELVYRNNDKYLMDVLKSKNKGQDFAHLI